MCESSMCFLGSSSGLQTSGLPMRIKLPLQQSSMQRLNAASTWFARSLRAAKVNVQSASCKEFFYWTAFMLRMTVADVETHHSRNLRTSGLSKSGNVSFTTIATQYVATEQSDLRRSVARA